MEDRYKILLIILFFTSAVILLPENISADSELILVSERGETYVTNSSACPFGSYFYREPHPVDCICSKGLWIFYENACGRPKFIQGSEGLSCLSIDFKIRKSLLISEDLDPTLTVLHPKDGIIMKLVQNSINYPFQMFDGELIMSSGEWSLEMRSGKTFCLGMDQSFCIYESEYLEGDIVDFVVRGCHAHATDTTAALRLKHLRCAEFLRGPPNVNQKCQKGRGHRSKRQYKTYTVQGRAMIPASMAMNPEFNKTYWDNETKWNLTEIPPESEDYYNVTRDGHPLIKTQIWNYFTEKATEILDLYEFDRVKPQNRIAAFQFLEIARDIFGIRCPTHYVPHAHLELSVGAFRAIQLRDFLYEEPPITHEEYDRIMKVLKKCKNNTNDSFPFTLVTKVCNETYPVPAGIDVTDDPLETMGMFHMFDEDLFIDVPNFMGPQEREPIIDTVWNIYMHAHSFCFQYFNHSAFNDHHKFTTIMMSLFSNGIQDLWLEVKNLTSDIYGGLIGDAVVLMQRVVHCAATSRIENDTTYPWDLRRLNDSANATEAPPARRKRQVPLYEKNEHQAHLGCLQSLDQNSYVCQE